MRIIITSIIRKDLAPFIVLAMGCIASFEISSHFFVWVMGRDSIFGEYFNMFSSVAEDLVDYQKDLGIIWWDRPPDLVVWLTCVVYVN